MIPRPSRVFPCRATARSSSTLSACGTLPGIPAPNRATPSSSPSRAATPSTNGSRASRSHSDCHSERSEESACAQSKHPGSLGFFAALRMTANGVQRNLTEYYTHARRVGRWIPPNPSRQGEEEEKGDVVLCFRVKVPVEQAIQDGGMLLQRRHEGRGLCLRQVAIFDRLVHDALHRVQDDGVQLGA